MNLAYLAMSPAKSPTFFCFMTGPQHALYRKIEFGIQKFYFRIYEFLRGLGDEFKNGSDLGFRGFAEAARIL